MLPQVRCILEQHGQTLPMPDLKSLLRLYRARLALSCRNVKAAKKELKAVLAGLPGCEAALVLKAELEAGRQHPRKALKGLLPLVQHAPTLRRYVVRRWLHDPTAAICCCLCVIIVSMASALSRKVSTDLVKASKGPGMLGYE